MNSNIPSINNWPEEDRPREKLFNNGEHTLNNSELLAILLRTGMKGQSAIDLARKILAEFKTFRRMSHADLSQWKKLKGLGPAKIAQIKAAIEIGRRFREDQTKEKGLCIELAEDVVNMFMPRMRDLKKEVVKVLALDSRNKVTHIKEVEEGTVNYSAPIVREIFEMALQQCAVSLICIHNHPSGDPAPSEEDKRFTQELSSAGKILRINVLDHIIIGDNKYYSFADEGAIL